MFIRSILFLLMCALPLIEALASHHHPTLSALSGDNQTGVINDKLPQPLVVQVRGDEDKPQANAQVTFSTISGTTKLPLFVTNTDINGIAKYRPELLGYGAVKIAVSHGYDRSNPVIFTAVGTGWMSTIAGDGIQAYGGEGDPLKNSLAVPLGLSFDSNDNLFIADYGNNRIRRLDAVSGQITTVAGNGELGYSNDGGLAIEARLNRPYNVFVDDEGDLIQRLMRQSRQIFGLLPEQASSDRNPVNAKKALLGRRLFHEKRLSADNSVSCATCHPLDKFGMDGLKVARGIHGQLGNRNTPSVYNAALQNSQFRDGRAPDVESQARGPMLHPKEIGMADERAVVNSLEMLGEYTDDFKEAFLKSLTGKVEPAQIGFVPWLDIE